MMGNQQLEKPPCQEWREYLSLQERMSGRETHTHTHPRRAGDDIISPLVSFCSALGDVINGVMTSSKVPAAQLRLVKPDRPDPHRTSELHPRPSPDPRLVSRPECPHAPKMSSLC